MKLLFITNNFPPIVDGVGDYTFHLAHEFTKYGHEISIICSNKPEIIEFTKKNELGFEVYPIVRKWNINGILTIYRKIKQLRPDWVLLQYVPYSFNRYGVNSYLFLLVLLIKATHTKLLINFHETYIRFKATPLKYCYPAIGQRIILFILALFSDKATTSIDRYKNQIQRWNKNISVVPIGSNIQPWNVPIETINEIKKKFAPKGEKLLCTFGRKDPKKLISVFNMLLQHDQHCVLLVIGKQNLHGLEYNFEKIKMTGYLPEKMVYAHLKASDGFISADQLDHKKRGGSSLKSGSLVAALAAGLPIIGFMGDMTDQVLIKYPLLYLLENHCEISFDANNIYEFINNQHNREKIKNASCFYDQYLSTNCIYCKYLNILNDYEETVLR